MVLIFEQAEAETERELRRLALWRGPRAFEALKADYRRLAALLRDTGGAIGATWPMRVAQYAEVILGARVAVDADDSARG